MSLADTYDRHDGSLEGYSLGTISAPLASNKHYNIRIFDNAGIVIPWSILQMELYNYQKFSTYTMLQLETGEIAPNSTENWTNTTTIGANSTYRYANTLTKSVTVGSPQTVTSTITDDISTDFSDAQYIELVLKDFPAQSAAARLDLANSYIDFTSSGTYVAGQTDSIAFSSSLVSLTNGGNVVFRINRTSLVNCTLTNVIGIRFRLTAAGAGTMTFIAQALRLIPQSGHTYEIIEPETRREVLAHAIPETGNQINFGNAIESVRTATTDPYTFNFTPTRAANGIVVAATHGVSSTDHITTMTYGGVSMSRINTASDAAGEPGRADLWFLGSNIPTGTQTVSVDLASATTDDIHFVCIALHTNDGSNIEVIDSDTQSADASNPSLTLQYGGREAIAIGALYSGHDAPGSFASNANCTTIFDEDLGTFSSVVLRQTNPGTADFAIGGTATIEDLAFVAAAFARVETTFGWIYFNDVRPIDNVFWARFHNGVNPVGNDNTLALAFRHQDADMDAHRVTLTARSTQSRISIDYWDGATPTNIVITTAATNILTANKDYYLRVELDRNQINAGIYTSIGNLIGSLVYETGWQTMVNDIRNGYVGYSFAPYNYDFYLYNVGSTYSEFGNFESTIFQSQSYVRGATLYEYSSKNIEHYTDATYDLVGDAITSTLVDETYSVTRSGNEWFGGLTTVEEEFIGDTRYAKVSGEILAAESPRGEYRILLRDGFGQVVWTGIIDPVVKNQWRTFNFLLKTTLIADKYTLQVHQTGYYPDTFKIRNLQLSVDAVAWFASNNGGTNYYPFLNSINGEHTALQFPSPGTELRVRGFLMDADGWIQGYKLKPIYMFGGHELSA